MASDKTQDKTKTAGVQMDDGSNAGKELARPTPGQQQQGQKLSAIEQAKANMLADVENNRGEIIQFLGAFGIEYDFFVGGLRVFLLRQQQNDPEFFTKVSAASFMEALFRIAMNGLIPDGKEAAIANYKGVATPMFMRDGFVKVLWRTGMIKSINDNIVTIEEDKEGRFEFEEGDHGFIRHRPSLSRKDTDPVAAAYCVIHLMTGGIIREVVPADELAKIRAMSKSPARGAWKHQMDRKAAIRRIMGKMPREKAIAQLLAHDEAAYDNTLIGGGENRRAPPREALLSDRAHTPEEDRDQTAGRDGKAEPAREEPQGDQVDSQAAGESDDDPTFSPQRAAAILKAMGALDAAEDGTSLAEAVQAMDEDPLLADCTTDERERIRAKVRDRKAAVLGGVVELTAILTKAEGERTFDDPRVWEVEIMTAMGGMEGKKLAAFWFWNKPRVLAAADTHPEHAGRVLERAKVAGLEVEPDV